MVLELSYKHIIAFNTTNFDFFLTLIFFNLSNVSKFFIAALHCFNNREVMTTQNSIIGNLKKSKLLAFITGVLCSCKNKAGRSLSTDMEWSPSYQFSSVTQSRPTLCDRMNRSTPSLPVHHQLPESTQTHVHQVGDAIQASHPLSPPSPPALSLSQNQGLFKWLSFLHQMTKVLEFQLQHQSFQWTPRTDLLYDGLVESPCSPRDSQESSPTLQFESINLSALSFLHSPTLTSIHDYWKNHSLD